MSSHFLFLFLLFVYLRWALFTDKHTYFRNWCLVLFSFLSLTMFRRSPSSSLSIYAINIASAVYLILLKLWSSIWPVLSLHRQFASSISFVILRRQFTPSIIFVFLRRQFASSIIFVFFRKQFAPSIRFIFLRRQLASSISFALF